MLRADEDAYGASVRVRTWSYVDKSDEALMLSTGYMCTGGESSLYGEEQSAIATFGNVTAGIHVYTVPKVAIALCSSP